MKSKLQAGKLIVEIEGSLEQRHEQQREVLRALRSSHKFRLELSEEAKSSAIEFSDDLIEENLPLLPFDNCYFEFPIETEIGGDYTIGILARNSKGKISVRVFSITEKCYVPSFEFVATNSHGLPEVVIDRQRFSARFS